MAFEKRVEIRPGECGLSRRAGPFEFAAPDESQRRPVADRRADVRENGRVVVRVVWRLIVRRRPGSPECVIDVPGEPGHGSVTVHGAKRSALEETRHVW